MKIFGQVTVDYRLCHRHSSYKQMEATDTIVEVSAGNALWLTERPEMNNHCECGADDEAPVKRRSDGLLIRVLSEQLKGHDTTLPSG